MLDQGDLGDYLTFSRAMESIFLRNGRYAAHVGLCLRPLLGCFGEEVFKSRRSDIDEHADWLIRIVLETDDRAAGWSKRNRLGTSQSRYRSLKH